MNTPP